MGLFRRNKYKVPPTEISDAATHGHLTQDIIAGGDDIDAAVDSSYDSFGPDAAKAAAEEAAAGEAARAKLEAEHGADYHGFGHPPEHDD